MNFSELIHQRRACHHFQKGVQIPDEDISKMIEMTSLTPSGYNAQPWEFVVVRDRENLQKLHEIAFEQPHVQDASAVIIVLGDMNIGRRTEELVNMWIDHGYVPEERRQALSNSIGKNRSPEKRREMALRNAMLASMTLIYAAEDLGYATCPMMGFSQWQLEEFLEVPEDRLVALMIAVGKADDSEPLKRLPRKEVGEMIHWEKFGEQS